ncbi:hypothetical protein DF186_17835, partial [Enterococcus hirae]
MGRSGGRGRPAGRLRADRPQHLDRVQRGAHALQPGVRGRRVDHVRAGQRLAGAARAGRGRAA